MELDSDFESNDFTFYHTEEGNYVQNQERQNGKNYWLKPFFKLYSCTKYLICNLLSCVAKMCQCIMECCEDDDDF